MTRFLGMLLLACASPLAAQSAPGPQPGADPVMGAARPLYEQIKDYLIRAAEQMPEERYAFRPTPDVRSFGEIVGHVANSQYFFCSMALGERSPNAEDFEQSRTTKAGLVEALGASFTYCDRAYAMSDGQATRTRQIAGSPQASLYALIWNIGHNNEHYGNLVTYMRMNGLVPPSSQPGV